MEFDRWKKKSDLVQTIASSREKSLEKATNTEYTAPGRAGENRG